MKESVLLVDFENIRTIDLSQIPPGVRVPFFFGASQRTVTRAFFTAARKLGDRFVEIVVEGHGKNALDFHIAFYLGEYLKDWPSAEFIILSKDKGFDPLIKHLQGRSFRVRRAETLVEAFPEAAKAAPDDPQYARTVAFLTKIPKKNRPRKRASLCAHIANAFKEASKADVQGLVDRLISKGLVSESGEALTYNF